MSASAGPAHEAVVRSLAAAREREPQVRAFAHLAETAAFVRARAVDAAAPGDLSGLTVGVKDLIDTATMPTTYGSMLYADHRPTVDATVVKLIEAAGGCVLGKTVTTEFALMTPGPTTNPHRASHTPGGSSSGSAAAVAAGMVDVGIGTQTYGSVVRPSSFCGVFGFKPTLAAVPTAGVRPLAPAFDTVGWMAGTLDLVVRVLVALTGAQSGTRFHDPRVGTVYAGRATRLSDAIRALPGIQTAVSSAEVNVQPVGLEGELELLSSLHGVVAEHQIGRALKGEYEDSRPGLSTPLKEFVRRGLAISEDACAEAVAELAARAPTILDVFSTVDVVLGPSARGEAPRGLAFTGDPCFCTPWTALGCPALNVPASTGATGLPIGVQLVAAPGRDADLLHAARVLFPSLPPSAAQVGGW